jgi:hypothetical protein
MMKTIAGNIARLEAEEAAERRRIKAEDEASLQLIREQDAAIQRKLEREASPDSDEVKRLFAVIEDASEAEKFLAKIWAAERKHHAANDARAKLRETFDAQSKACAELGRRVPTQPAIPEMSRG